MTNLARTFAITAHAEQKYGERPYGFHLDQVVEYLSEYCELAQTVGYLHDVVEDTPTTCGEIAEKFGEFVAECVALLTDEPGSTRKERKAKTYEKLARVTGPAELALIVKAADRLANVKACIADRKLVLWRVYQSEHPTFRAAAYRPGQCEPLWQELDRLLQGLFCERARQQVGRHTGWREMELKQQQRRGRGVILDKINKSNQPPKKHQPKGLSILHEDKEIIVVVKPAGLLTIGTEREKLRTVHYLLNDYVRKGNSKSRNRVYVVHRLDKDTSGVLVFAKSEQSKKFLQMHWQESEKHYLAIVHGSLTVKEGTISSFLVENNALRVYSTHDAAKGKLSHTAYKVMEESARFSLLDIHLLTGRKHQIRVHLAEKGHPVAGDKKYGKKDIGLKRLALHARSISFPHPFTRKTMSFDTGIPEDFIHLFRKL